MKTALPPLLPARQQSWHLVSDRFSSAAVEKYSFSHRFRTKSENRFKKKSFVLFMTIDEFLVELEHVSPLYSWQYYGENRELRGYDFTELYCPITSVSSRKSGHYCHIDDAVFYGCGYIGLSEEDADEIIDAADNSPNADAMLRHKLTQAVGLVK